MKPAGRGQQRPGSGSGGSAAPASLLLWLPWGCSGILSVPTVAMHSAVSGTSPLAGGFLGLGGGWDARQSHSGGSWGQLGLGGRGLCLGPWGAGQGHLATVETLRPDRERPGISGQRPGLLRVAPQLGLPPELALSCPDCRQLQAWRGWASGSGSFPQAGHKPGEWGPQAWEPRTEPGPLFTVVLGLGAKQLPPSTF